jgi:hypothetical protein
MVHLVCRLLDASVNFSRRPGSPWCPGCKAPPARSKASRPHLSSRADRPAERCAHPNTSNFHRAGRYFIARVLAARVEPPASPPLA